MRFASSASNDCEGVQPSTARRHGGRSTVGKGAWQRSPTRSPKTAIFEHPNRNDNRHGGDRTAQND